MEHVKFDVPVRYFPIEYTSLNKVWSMWLQVEAKVGLEVHGAERGTEFLAKSKEVLTILGWLEQASLK
jgi:hypothetical protein